MSSFLKNHRSSIILISALLLGGAAGALWGDKVNVVKPLGDIFLNILFVLVVPLVFCSISMSIVGLKKNGMIGRVLGLITVVFSVMLVVSGLLGWLGVVVFDPVGDMDRAEITRMLSENMSSGTVSIGDAITAALTVPDFGHLFYKTNLLAIILFSALLGLGISAAGEKGEPIATFLESGMEVVMKIMEIVMKVAPLGLGCYFACTVAFVGKEILTGYLRAFLLYLAVAAVIFFVGNTIYMFCFGGWKLVRTYWKNVIPPAITALATSSSSAAIPQGIQAAKDMGVSPSIAETVIPLGTNIHKDGSMWSGVLKAAFLMILIGGDVASGTSMLAILGIGFLSTLVIGAIPTGSVTGELLICTLLGVDPAMAGIIIVIGTIVDMPSTVLNACNNVAAAVLVDRLNKK